MFVCFFGWKHAHRVCSKLYLILKAANEGFPKSPEFFLKLHHQIFVVPKIFLQKKRLQQMCVFPKKIRFYKGETQNDSQFEDFFGMVIPLSFVYGVNRLQYVAARLIQAAI